MADYFSILSKTVSGLKNNDSQMREAVYQRARSTIEKQLRNMDPVPSEETISTQLSSLQEAVDKLESEYTLSEPETVDIDPSSDEVSSEGQEDQESDGAGTNEEVGLEETTEQHDKPAEEEQAQEPEPEPEPEPSTEDATDSADAQSEEITPELDAPAEITEETADETKDETTSSSDESEQTVDETPEPSDEESVPEAEAPFVIPSAEPSPEIGSEPPVDEALEVKSVETLGEPESDAPVIDTSDEPQIDAPDVDPVDVTTAEPESVEAVEEPVIETPETVEGIDSADMANIAVETPVDPLTEAPIESLVDPITPDTIDSIVEPVLDDSSIDSVDAPTLGDEVETPDMQVAGSEPETVDLAPPPSISLEQEVAQSAAEAEIEGSDEPVQSPTSDALDAVAAAVEEDDKKTAAQVSDLDAQEKITKKSGKFGCWLFIIFLLAALAGIGYGAWLNKDSLMEKLDGFLAEYSQPTEEEEETVQSEEDSTATKEAVRIGEDGQDASADPVEESDSTSGETELAVDIAPDLNTTPNPDPEPEPEVTPVTPEPEPTEETTQAEETVTPEEPQQPEEPQKPEEPVIETVEEGEQTTQDATPEPSTLGEVAYLYEAGPAGTGAIRVNATVAWELKKYPEPVEGKADTYIQGKMEIPERDMSLNLVIDRNLDEGLSASHLIDIKFDLPEGFKGQGIDSVARFVMKTTEEAEGEALVAVPVKVKDNHFLIALDNVPNAEKFNMQLLSSGAWIDVPINYSDGKRALLALEKGGTGDQVFKEAFTAWAK